jgi:serine/threonine protein kinase
VHSAQPTVRIVGRYALYGTIAAGGMATVHFGRLLGPVGFSRTVAIKRLHPQFASDPEFVSMFLDEARLAARIRHPHVVPTLDVVATNGELFLVMDYVPGESLARLVRASRERAERIPVNVTIAIMSGVLQGLHAAHEAHNEHGEPLGIVHRDVSPQNVLVGSDGQARVLDFGVAKATGRVQTTREGQLKGKLSYMAPEQLRSETLTRKTDIYAASVVLWEALTCERLFAGDNEGAVVTKVLQSPVTAPSMRLVDLTRTLDSSVMRGFERLDAAVLRGLDRDPARRFDSAREMALALEKCFTPATAAEVSDWVEGIARPVLMARRGQIAEIESGSSSMPRTSQIEGALRAEEAGNAWRPEFDPQTRGSLGGHPQTPGSLGGHPQTPGSLGGHPQTPGGEVETQAAISSGNVQSPSQLSSISVASNASLPPPRPRRRLGMVLLAVTGVLVVPLAVFAFWRNTHFGAGAGLQPPVSASPPSTSALPLAASEGSAALVSPPVPAAPEATTTGSPTAALDQPHPAPPATHTNPAPTARPRPPRPPPDAPISHPTAAAPAADGCNPPYTWDSEGRKHYKPNCL